MKTAVSSWISQRANNPFLRNIGWLGSSEALIRVFRLVTTVALARFLSPEDYGLAALVLTTNEFVKVFASNGIGSKVIQAEEGELNRLLPAAYSLSWVVFIGLFFIQCLAAFPIAWFYHNNALILPIAVLALNYLSIPWAYIQVFLIQREGRLKIFALTNTIQVTADNLLALVFACLGFGMWSIILPKLLVGPLWVYLIRRNHPWRPSGGFTTEGWGELFQFGRNVLGVELLKTLRNNLDYLIIGRFLGVKALGVYYFAFNAGLGLSLGVINAINAALLPHLCAAQGNRSEMAQRYFQSLRTITLLVVPLVILQTSLAPFYVPLVFGAKWHEAIPLLMLICLSAIPRPYADAAAQLLVAINQPQWDLWWGIAFTGIFTVGLLLGVQGGSLGVAVAVCLTHFLALPIFTLAVTRYVFKPQEA